MNIKTYGIAKKNRSISDIINQNNSIIFIIFCFLLGFLTGVLFFKFKNTGGTFYSENFSRIYSGFKSGFWKVFINSAIEIFPFAAGIFLSGTCMIGAVLVPSVMIIRGAWISLTMSYTYCNFGLTGIVFNLLILIPAYIISTIAMSLSARESLGFSMSLAKLALPGSSSPKIEQDFKMYCLRQLFILLFFVISCFVQSVMSISFIQFFNF